MRHTLTFTEEHEAELRRIATLSDFASNIAKTILSGDFYKCSPKQAYILNKVAKGVEFEMSDETTQVNVSIKANF